MSREDHSLAVMALRDSLSEACDLAEQGLPHLTNGARSSAVEKLEMWRLVVERTNVEDAENDPPFSEHAKQAAWDAWCAAHARCGRKLKRSRIDRSDTDDFIVWWMTRAASMRPKSPSAACPVCKTALPGTMWCEVCDEDRAPSRQESPMPDDT